MAKTQRFYFIDTHSTGEKIAIVEEAKNTITQDGYTDEYKTVSSAKGIKIRGVFTDTDLAAGTLDGSYSNIPSRFHSAIAMHVISMGYLDPRNMNMENSQIFSGGYQDGVKKAKRFARSNYVSTGRVVPQDF